ncbi:hypothetical protein Anas_04308 [Armadillidium nasatum]|uniref:Uncharacterized protein n=1 Tax=Armadillidium nasatum TaxID=96803 RepID=A0A5N5STH4_9CRUS|nr:hypothetical protein Anas_04308 [Armadillidium nasatum]
MFDEDSHTLCGMNVQELRHVPDTSPLGLPKEHSPKGLIMLERGSSQFGIIDYCVFGAMLVFSGAIGLYTSYIGNKSPEEFLMGNRSFKPMPVIPERFMPMERKSACSS